MTKSAAKRGAAAAPTVREPRPFLFLEPQRVATADVEFTPDELRELDGATSASLPTLVRSLVNFTIALQNRRALEHGDVQPIQLSVLNRRRRAARAWILAVIGGRTDAGTRRAVASQWLPTLCGTGPDRDSCVAPAARLVEFVRGAITACIFDAPAANLLPHAKALHVLESVLAVHLAAVRESAQAASPARI